MNGPTKPFGHNFSQNPTNKRMFVENWLTLHNWLEYSIERKQHIASIAFFLSSSP